jgi:CDK inhibitor PHO81
LASLQGSLPIVQLLLNKKGIEINSIDIFHRTPLFHAASAGHLRCVSILLSRGANPEIANTKGEVCATLSFIITSILLHLLWFNH